MSSIEEILENMDDLLDNSKTLPFTSKILIDAEQMRELINDVRLNIPQEIKRAKVIDFDRERILKSAEEQAESIIRNAETKKDAMISEQEITKEAKKRAVEILNKAQNTSKEVRAALDQYVEKRLTDVETELQNTISAIKTTKNKYSSYKK
ncbi:MAG: vacuolar-type H+-ATPase subunit H [Oscillospiraceae bacterium]|nr:vacuolar-type H+-ATPase subunit H [Oscillospiraceae bacterium]